MNLNSNLVQYRFMTMHPMPHFHCHESREYWDTNIEKQYFGSHSSRIVVHCPFFMSHFLHSSPFAGQAIMFWTVQNICVCPSNGEECRIMRHERGGMDNSARQMWPELLLNNIRISLLSAFATEEMGHKGISHPIFNGDLFYNPRRARGLNNFIPSGTKIEKHLRDVDSVTHGSSSSRRQWILHLTLLLFFSSSSYNPQTILVYCREYSHVRTFA